MKVKEFIEKTVEAFDGKDLHVGITFELELDHDCNIMTGGGQKVKFSCRSKKLR